MERACEELRLTAARQAEEIKDLQEGIKRWEEIVSVYKTRAEEKEKEEVGAQAPPPGDGEKKEGEEEEKEKKAQATIRLLHDKLEELLLVHRVLQRHTHTTAAELVDTKQQLLR